MMCIIIYKKVDLKNLETFLPTTAWTVFTCIMFLSSMHERYGYLLDIILIVYAAVSAKHLWIPIVSMLISLRGYCYYLFSYELINLKFTAIIYTALYVYITFLLVKTIFGAKSSIMFLQKQFKIKHILNNKQPPKSIISGFDGCYFYLFNDF